MPSKRKFPHGSVAHALLAAVKKGDVGGVSALIAAENPDIWTRTSVMTTACLVPKAVAFLEAFGLCNRAPHGFCSHNTVTLFEYACRHGADPSTVVYIVQSMRLFMFHSKSFRLWWEGLSIAIARKNAVLVRCVSEALGDYLYDAHDMFLTKVIESADKAFALRVVNSSAVRTLLTDIEKSFEPTLIAEPASGSHGQSSRSPRIWVTTAVKNAEKCEIVELIYQRCPFVVGESVFLYCHHCPTTTRTRARWTLAKERYALFNNDVKDILNAVQAGDVQAVAAKLEESSILVNARDANGVQALTLSSTSPNALALLVCFRQHLHKHDRGKSNIPASVYCHVSQNGGDSATLAFLMDWLGECASRSTEALWDGVKQALTKQHLPMLTHLLQVGRSSGDVNLNKLTWLALESNINDFSVALFESEAMQEYLGTLDPLGLDDEVTTWVAYGVERRLPRLVDCMDRWSPQSTRRAMFVFCIDQHLTSPTWLKFSRRYEMDVKWPRIRAAYLVQRRRLPGLDGLGRLIAKFAEDVLDPRREFNDLRTCRSYSYQPIRNLATVNHNGQVRRIPRW